MSKESRMAKFEKEKRKEARFKNEDAAKADGELQGRRDLITRMNRDLVQKATSDYQDHLKFIKEKKEHLL